MKHWNETIKLWTIHLLWIWIAHPLVHNEMFQRFDIDLETESALCCHTLDWKCKCHLSQSFEMREHFSNWSYKKLPRPFKWGVSWSYKHLFQWDDIPQQWFGCPPQLQKLINTLSATRYQDALSHGQRSYSDGNFFYGFRYLCHVICA